MPDHFVQSRHQVFGFVAIFLAQRNFLGRRGEFLERAESGGMRQCARAAEEQKTLAAVFFVNLVFVREIVADGGHMKIAGLDQGFHRLGDRRLHALLAVLREPRRVILEVLRVVRDFAHQGVHGPVGDGDEALRSAFDAARIAIDFDEAVGEIDGRVVLHPIGIELQPILGIAGLVIADQIANGFGLAGFGDLGGFCEIGIGFCEIFGVEAGRHAAVGRSGAIDLLDQFPVDFREPRVQRIVLGEILEIGQCDVRIEVVCAGLQDVEPAARILGRDRRLEVRIEKRRAQLGDFFFKGGRGVTGRAMCERRQAGRAQLIKGEIRQKLLRGGVVVIPATGPEQLGKREDLSVGRRIHARRDARRSSPERASGVNRSARI